MNKIAPQDMRQHSMLNQGRLSEDEDVAQEIEDYWDATEEFSREEKGSSWIYCSSWERPCETRERCQTCLEEQG